MAFNTFDLGNYPRKERRLRLGHRMTTNVSLKNRRLSGEIRSFLSIINTAAFKVCQLCSLQYYSAYWSWLHHTEMESQLVPSTRHTHTSKMFVECVITRCSAHTHHCSHKGMTREDNQ